MIKLGQLLVSSIEKSRFTILSALISHPATTGFPVIYRIVRVFFFALPCFAFLLEIGEAVNFVSTAINTIIFTYYVTKVYTSPYFDTCLK